ncbi:MAG: 4Fe-4S ferredoxin [Gemmatimonadales bacterium]|nr:MAG: 4Fe-4S ferredoxin [Gemmatimonadales bacterium]
MLWLLLIPSLMLFGLLTLWLVGERGHLMLPSTREALTSRREGRRGGLVNALHGYVYGRWCYQYIKLFVYRVAPRVSSGFKRVWADHYHGKVLPTNLACEIIRLDHDIERTDLEHIIPYSTARDIVLTNSPGVTLLECPCRAAREDPCRPTQVCMLVGGGDWVLEHHPDRARRATQQEALELLQAEHERGHVHTAYFKDACDHRFYAICNCCRCCCGGLIAMQRHAVPMVASSGFVAEVDEGACIACGDCEEACPFDAITVNGRAAVIWESCMGCGVCEGQCETGAIALVLDERKGIPLDVRKIGLGLPPGVREAAIRGSVPELSNQN